MGFLVPQAFHSDENHENVHFNYSYVNKITDVTDKFNTYENVFLLRLALVFNRVIIGV